MIYRNFQRIDQFLRGEALDAATGRWLAFQTLIFGMIYGAAMGLYGGITGDRIWQILYSALKVPLLLQLTFGLALPSFFVLNTLGGLRDDFHRAVRALLATHSALTIVLASLAPVTLLWYASFDDYFAATMFNGVMFGIATISSQIVLKRLYAPLIAEKPRHRQLLRVWFVLYSFIGIQLAWLLRPFIGSLGQPVQFFRPGAWGNAYVILTETIWSHLKGP